jgi:hypothetical protein
VFSKQKVSFEPGVERLDVSLGPHGYKIFVTAK